MFIATCWKILQDPNYASVIRQSSGCYLSSFLARAKYVNREVVVDQIKRLCEWTHRYIDLQDENSRADKNKHGPFYSACQALFYIFLYHYKSLLESSDGLTFLKSLNLVRVVTSRLNPLKFCLESVVNLFARVTRMYQIVFCYSIIERNNRINFQQINNNGSSEETSKADEHDKSFFPFDPYLLPNSNKWVTPYYVNWNLSVLEDESDDEDEEDISDANAADTSDLSDNTEALNKSVAGSFDMMCISPGFQLQNINAI